MAKNKRVKANMQQVCDICGGTIKGNAYNAWPIVETGCCCGRCNDEIVTPARFASAVREVEKRYGTYL